MKAAIRRLAGALAACCLAGLAPAAGALGSGYLYRDYDPYGTVTLETELLGSVDSPKTAQEVVRRQASSLSDRQKGNPSDVELATLYAETASAMLDIGETVDYVSGRNPWSPSPAAARRRWRMSSGAAASPSPGT